MSYYYTLDKITDSTLNKTYDELFNCSDDEFKKWVDDFREAVTKQWDNENQPPKNGVKLEEFKNQFERICNVDTSLMWKKDEHDRKFDCISNSTKVSIASSFFPNILKAGDTLSDSKSVSVYNCYAKDELKEHTLRILTNTIKKDSFYEFAPVYRVPKEFKKSLRSEGKRYVKEVLTNENNGESHISIWLEKTAKSELRTPRVSASELRKFKENGILEEKHIKNEILDTVDDDTLFRIRVYGIGKNGRKVIPTVYRHIELGGAIAPNNFPSAIAKFLYKKYAVDHCNDQNEVVIYDPSMGFGGRLLGALSLREKKVHYVGTDPNTENWIAEIGISRYEYLEKVFKSHIRWGEDFKATYICSGSEEVYNDIEFKKLKGKLDFVFTSPPYFSAEMYCDEPTQSSIKFSTYESWRDDFLRKTLETCVEWLKPNRYLAFNIADINIGTTSYPLESDTIEILQSLGMEYKQKLKMMLAKIPSAQMDHYGKLPKIKNFCKVNGNWRKYEPIFIFYKGE